MTTTEHPRAELPPEGPTAASVERRPDPPPQPTVGSGPDHRVRAFLTATAGYLVLSLFLWWHVWSTHPTSTTTCGCGDSSLFTWFLAWPAYAISHGLNPLYSTALFHPSGVNLLSNTAEVGIAVVLAPVTWLFGPVATLNVALTLSPALSALAMFVLLRRWVSWTPAAFIGGLAYGFSPFILIALTDAHLMLAMAPVPPLMVACLDEMLIRQRRTPLATGVLLGVLVFVQFFIGSEVLVLVAIAAGIGVALLFLYGLVHRDALRSHIRHAVAGLVSAGITATVLLAYPVWFALAGPAHLSGPIWGASDISYGGNDLRDYLLPSTPSPAFTALDHHFGGYQAPTLSGQYVGIGLIAVLVIGVVVWRRDRRLWLFGAVGVISVPLSMGLQFHRWTLWRLFVRLPLMDNIIPSRFLVITYLAAAVMLGLIVDHAGIDTTRWLASRHGVRDSGPNGRWRMAGSAAAVVVALVALVPIAWYYSSGVPLTTQPVVLPAWFRSVAPHLGPDQVVLAFPVPFALFQSAMTWQAVDGMSFAMVGGGGPDALPARAGREAAGQTDIGNLSISSAASQTITPKEVVAVRQALDGWGVTMVVVPDPTHLPTYEQLHLVRDATVLMTAATGQPPVRQADAWVWTGVDRAGPPILASGEHLTACGAGPPDGTVASIDRSTACVLATARS
jgi:hypothetical protein